MNSRNTHLQMFNDNVGNKAKGRISKQVLQESKARQSFWKKNISYPLVRARTCAYHGLRNVRFSENLCALLSFNIRFEIHPFALLPKIHDTHDTRMTCEHLYIMWVLNILPFTWENTKASSEKNKREFLCYSIIIVLFY